MCIICPYCGSFLANGTKFCPECGKNWMRRLHLIPIIEPVPSAASCWSRILSFAKIAGKRSHKPYMVALGSNVAAKDTKTSEFAHVEIVKVRRKRHTIHVNQLLDKNQVYAGDGDFDFVEKFILDRCLKAKIK